MKELKEMGQQEKHHAFRKRLRIYFGPESLGEKDPDAAGIVTIRRGKASDPELEEIYYETVKSLVNKAKTLSDIKKVLKWAHAPDISALMQSEKQMKLKYGIHDRDDLAKAVVEKLLTFELPQTLSDEEYAEFHSNVIMPYFPSLREKKSYEAFREALMGSKQNLAIGLLKPPKQE